MSFRINLNDFFAVLDYPDAAALSCELRVASCERVFTTAYCLAVADKVGS